MQAAAAPSTPRTRARRSRLVASGWREVLFELPDETVALLDEIKQRQGLRNRNLALMQLIEEGRKAAQQVA